MDQSILYQWWFYVWTIFSLVIGILVGTRIRFSSEKALARKEDIKKIQKKMESLFAQYNDWQAAGDAITHTGEDIRLQKHQEAYSLWISLLWQLKESDTNEGLAAALEACQRWWNDNCLYLSDMARTGLQEAMNQSFSFPLTLGGSEDRKEYYRKVYDAGKSIIIAANLTPLKGEEIRKALPSSASDDC